jgi:ABC-2 type transport system permease protein
VVVFPATFLANTFVPLGGLSPVLRTIASWNPVSTLAAAVRELFGNPTALPPDAPWPLHHAVVASVGWCFVLLAIWMPLAIRAFRKRTLD